MQEDVLAGIRQVSTPELEDFLVGIDYPATKREVLDVAYDNGAPDHILGFLNIMPDQEYHSLMDVLMAAEDLR